LTEVDNALPSERNRVLLLRVGSRYVAYLVMVIHLPLAWAVGWDRLLDTVLPSFAFSFLNLTTPAIQMRFGTLPGWISFIGYSTTHTVWMAIWCGVSSGIHYFLFSISAVGVIAVFGLSQRWALAMALWPMGLFIAIEIGSASTGQYAPIRPDIAPWFAGIVAAASFCIIIGIGGLFAQVTAEAERLLLAEKDRSERLLLNILPAAIARRLTAGGEQVIADRVPEVSVMFADLVGFTPYARDREPAAVVQTLNELFSRFDARVDAAGLEKIKTVGDAYVVIAGTPTPQTDHLAALAGLALDLLDEVRAYRDADGHRFAVRIGLYVGPVVTGVIGTRKMAYDAWGDTVNVASRLESTGVPDRIHVSSDVAARLSGWFTFEARGPMEIKGVGMMQTSFLTARAARATP